VLHTPNPTTIGIPLKLPDLLIAHGCGGSVRDWVYQLEMAAELIEEAFGGLKDAPNTTLLSKN